jgi:hypothetical protein
MFTLDSLKRDGVSWQTALSLASASKLAYQSESLVTNVATTSWGFAGCRNHNTTWERLRRKGLPSHRARGNRNHRMGAANQAIVLTVGPVLVLDSR